MTGLPMLGRARPFRQRSVVLLLMAAGFAACWLLVDVPTGFCRRPYGSGAVEYDVNSGFSHIRIRKQDSVRTLLFVGQYGDEVVESALDLNQPHHLLVPYSRTMFASYLFKRNQQRVMIVGLGGGSMVHFLKRHAPKLQIDVVEIDPAIVKVADEYFGVRAGGNLRIITADGVEHLATTQEHYDVIYMDAFLRPSPKTDGTGVPIELATAEFLKKVAARVNADGLVVFNLHQHAGVDDDIGVIRNVFPQVYRFEVPTAGNLVVIASLNAARESVSTLERRGQELDRSFDVDFSFQEMVKHLTP